MYEGNSIASSVVIFSMILAVVLSYCQSLFITAVQVLTSYSSLVFLVYRDSVNDLTISHKKKSSVLLFNFYGLRKYGGLKSVGNFQQNVRAV